MIKNKEVKGNVMGFRFPMLLCAVGASPGRDCHSRGACNPAAATGNVPGECLWSLAVEHTSILVR